MTLSCSVCGFQRDDRAFYRRARSGFLNLPRRVCGGCLPDRPTREDRATLAGFVLPQALWLIPIAYASQDGGLSGTSLVVAAAVSVLSLPVRVLIHELGHALMARVVGAGAVTVSVGGGPERRSLRWAGIRFRLHAYPFAGGRTTYWLSTSRFRWRDAAVLVAGAGANVASGLAAVLLAYLLGEAESSAAQLALGGLTGFAVSSLWLAARSLMPTRGGSTVAHLPSDGWLLLQLLKPMLVISERDERVARVRTLNLAGLYEDVARESLEAALLPSHSVWLWSAALDALSKSKGHRAAVDCYLVHRRGIQASAAADDDGRRMLAWINGTVAWSALQNKDPALLSLAGDLSQSAIVEVPDAAALVATRGAWLVATDQVVAGVAMIESAIGDLVDLKDKSDFCGVLAGALHAIGEERRGGAFAALQVHLAGKAQ